MAGHIQRAPDNPLISILGEKDPAMEQRLCTMQVYDEANR